MSEPCICCREREITQKKRMLCSPCYHWLYTHRLLDEYPPINKLHDTIWWKDRQSEELINDLKDLIDNHHATLVQVGKKHSVTRERVRQMFELLYGFKYTVSVRMRTERKKRIRFEERIMRRDPRYKVENFKKGSSAYKGAETEKKVFDICASLNYEIKPSDSTSIDLIINGYKIEIKSAHGFSITNPRGKTPTYRFNILKSQNDVDFIICHAVPVNKFFVIPRGEFPNGGSLYLPTIKMQEWNTGTSQQVRVSKYYDYAEAWHLLKPKPADIIFSPLIVIPGQSAVG